MIQVILCNYKFVGIFAKIPEAKDLQDQIHWSTYNHQPIYHCFNLNMWQSLESNFIVHHVIHSSSYF